MKKRILFHLGLWKTGTTTLQLFLHDHAEALARIGVSYPPVAPDRVRAEIAHKPLTRGLTGRRPEAIRQQWDPVLRGFADGAATTMILSDENLSATPAAFGFDAIADRLAAFEVVGLLYLRPQESWALSMYAFEVRAARTAVDFGPYLAGRLGERLDYLALIEAIRTRFPLDRLILRDFEAAARGDLLGDFLAALDLPALPGAAPVRRNGSLPPWAVLFLRHGLRGGLEEAPLAEVRRALTLAAVNRGMPAVAPGLALATPAERAALRALAAAERPVLRERHGFAVAKPGPPRNEPVRPFGRDDWKAVRTLVDPRLGEAARARLDAVVPP